MSISPDKLSFKQLSIQFETSIETDLVGSTWDNLLQQLIPLILHLLQEDMTKLVQVLYRLDVNQQQVEAVIANEQKAEEIAQQIGSLIIEREKQKVISRQMYS